MDNLDLSEETTLVRLTIGDFEEPYILRDSVINFRLSKYPSSTSGARVWLASLDCLSYMKALFARNGGRKREREGGIEIEQYGKEMFQSICSLYDWLIQNPPSTNGFGTLHYFGGIDRNTAKEIEDDDEILDAGVKLNWFDDPCFTLKQKYPNEDDLT